MKLILSLCLFGYAAADLTGTAFVRDLLLESTTRGYEKNDATGDFICENGYTGADCSQRKCPYATSFVSGKEADWLYSPSNGQPQKTGTTCDDSNTECSSIVSNSFDNNHVYKECGGRGICDRTSGECKCFDSFTGEGCRRTVCPNDCSGHGICQTDALSYWKSAGVYANQVSGFSDSSTWGSRWNFDKFAQCSCDRGYEGDDCSERQCPFGDDPETECSDELEYDVQTVALTTTDVTNTVFTLTFEDQLGGSYSTRPIILSPGAGVNNAYAIQSALEALPNFAIPTVEVDMGTFSSSVTTFLPTSATGSGTYSFYVSFVDDATTNKQALLTVNSGRASGDCDSGAQPKFSNVVSSSSVERITNQFDNANNEMKEASECGGRGTCDRSTGLCTCFDGYFGESCSDITTYI